MATPKSAGIRHIALRVRDLNRMERFYHEVLGYAVEWRPDPENVYLTCGHDNLALHAVTGSLTTGAAQPLDHFGILVDCPEDVDAWATHLEGSGVPLAARPRTHRDGARSLYFDDPEGNRIQVIFHPPLAPK
jgi:catechol-2,3-dioxygenase